jgi:hypothetical protein
MSSLRRPSPPKSAAPSDRAAVLLASPGLPFSSETVEAAISVAKGRRIRVLSVAKVYGTALGLQHPGLLPSKVEMDAQRAIVAAAIKQIERANGTAKGEVMATRDNAKTFLRAAIRYEVLHVVLEPASSSRLRRLVEGDPASSLRRRLPPEVTVREVELSSSAVAGRAQHTIERRRGAERASAGSRASRRQQGGAGPGSAGSTASRRRRLSSPGGTAVIAIVVVLGAIVTARVVHDLGPKAKAPVLTAASPTVLRAVTHVAAAEQDAAGLPASVTRPAVLGGQSPLTVNGRPAAIYIGAEFCPLCAAERWAIVMAFSRFGTFSGLRQTTSSPWDSDPSTPTFSFYGSRYTSRYITFLPVERESNDTSGLGTRTYLQPITPLESQLWKRYEGVLGEPLGFPFLDVGNKVFVVTASYDPSVLAGLNQGEVAARLSDRTAALTLDIVGTANYLTAAICSVTAEQPAAVCSVSAVRKASQAMKLGSGS